MLIGALVGGVPSSVTCPVTAAAVAGSTGLVTGAAAGVDDSCGVLPPPQATLSAATHTTAHTDDRRAYID
jgi:hypothetical protein